MRTFKFRGRTHAGRWVYGDLVHEEGNTYIVENGEYFAVKASSVCQSIELKDADGNDIYEGDILIGLPKEEFFDRMESEGMSEAVRYCRRTLETGIYEPLENYSFEDKEMFRDTVNSLLDYEPNKGVVKYNVFAYHIEEITTAQAKLQYFPVRTEYWRIVGNIYDNPEMLNNPEYESPRTPS